MKSAIEQVMHVCDLDAPRSSSKARNLTFYLDRLKNEGRECERIEIYSTAGDIRPPYPYQYRAVSKIIPGDDDPLEGLGGTPLEAIRNLYHTTITPEPDDQE